MQTNDTGGGTLDCNIMIKVVEATLHDVLKMTSNISGSACSRNESEEDKTPCILTVCMADMKLGGVGLLVFAACLGTYASTRSKVQYGTVVVRIPSG